jgi:hypothetical protein
VEGRIDTGVPVTDGDGVTWATAAGVAVLEVGGSPVGGVGAAAVSVGSGVPVDAGGAAGGTVGAAGRVGAGVEPRMSDEASVGVGDGVGVGAPAARLSITWLTDWEPPLPGKRPIPEKGCQPAGSPDSPVE